MREKIEFEKVYTRDTTLIIQQAWLYTYEFSLKEKFNLNSPFQPFVIYYMNDGVIEIWENVKARKWLFDALDDMQKNNADTVLRILKEFETELKWFNKESERGNAQSRDEFVEFIEKLHQFMHKSFLMYFTAMSNATRKDIAELAGNLRENDHLFDTTDKYLRKSIAYLFPDIEKYAVCLLSKEVAGGIPSIDILKERYKHFVMMPGNVFYAGSIGSFFEKHPKYSLVHESLEKSKNEIKGQIAYKGVVKGRVRILRRKDQVGEFQDGEILVSPMTTPDYLLAMKKATAFVTDEGGLTCHAAIIARELKKPCIIGTKIATKVLKNGDLVEVDAERGVVRIVSRK